MIYYHIQLQKPTSNDKHETSKTSKTQIAYIYISQIPQKK